jgi:MoaA/NifB/PqqE/SkfB family radical SAM enzyme
MKRLPARWKFQLHLAYRLISNSSSGIPDLPIPLDTVRIDATSICQLQCPACPTGKGTNNEGTVGWGFLKFDHFKDFVDRHPTIKHIELSSWGEIFLNPQLEEIIAFAHRKNISLSALNGVNLNTASDEILECLVKYEFSYLLVSIDGVSNETYQIYRKGGDFHTVIDNIRKINLYKQRYDTGFPILCWQFVIFGHNEHELPEARQMAEELDMEFRPKLNTSPHFAPVKDREFVRKESRVGAADMWEYKKKHNMDYGAFCWELWNSPQINWDGKLLGCCVNIWDDFGNVFEDGLEECLQSERYVYAKKMLAGEKKAREDIPCTHCRVYQEMSRPLTLEDIHERTMNLP